MYFIKQVDFANQLLMALMPKYSEAGFTDDQVEQSIVQVINVLLFEPSEIPTGEDKEPKVQSYEFDANKNIEETADLFSELQPGKTAIAFVGEDHKDSDDKRRVDKFINRIKKAELSPDIILFERGMSYEHQNLPPGVYVVQEENLSPLHQGLTSKQRSMIAAGFLAVCNGSGNQQDISKNIIFYGENHKDILKFYYKLISLSNASYLKKKPSTYLLLLSSVQ